MDYKSKYLKYKQKYIDLKNINGGEHISVLSLSEKGNWNNKKFDGKINGAIRTNYGEPTTIDEDIGNGVWKGEWKNDNYIGKFINRSGKKYNLNIIGKWEEEADDEKRFNGWIETNRLKKKPEILKGLDSINFKDNVPYSLKNFISLKKWEDVDNFFGSKYWEITKLNLYFTPKELEKYFNYHNILDGNKKIFLFALPLLLGKMIILKKLNILFDYEQSNLKEDIINNSGNSDNLKKIIEFDFVFKFNINLNGQKIEMFATNFVNGENNKLLLNEKYDNFALNKYIYIFYYNETSNEFYLIDHYNDVMKYKTIKKKYLY